MRRKITIISLWLISITQIFAQSSEKNVDYKRSSIYSILINHTEQQFANEIREAFMQIPVPDKFNDHNLSVKVLDIDEKLQNAGSKKENPYITEFFEKNNVASRLVARWFNRDYYTGQCDMELVKERGLYNATEFDKQLAMRSARGYALLQDAGEELIGNTFVLVNDIRYVDKNKGAKTASTVLKVLGTVATIATGMNIDDITDNLGDMLETIKGFRVKINTFLYQLEWTDEQAALFYQEQYSSLPDNIKKANFDNARGTYKLKYVGKVESSGGTTSFLGINEDEPVIMVRKACQRAIDENIVDLQRNYEEFRIKTPLLTIVEKEDGTQKFNRVGIIEPIKNLIWDNRYMALEEGAPGSTLGFTTFRRVSGNDFAKGMLIREMKNK